MSRQENCPNCGEPLPLIDYSGPDDKCCRFCAQSRAWEDLLFDRIHEIKKGIPFDRFGNPIYELIEMFKDSEHGWKDPGHEWEDPGHEWEDPGAEDPKTDGKENAMVVDRKTPDTSVH